MRRTARSPNDVAIARNPRSPIKGRGLQSDKIDLRKVGKDIYELLTYPGRGSFKQRARKQTVELKPDKLYTPSEVAALLNVSYDTAVRRMQSMKGCVDMGTQTKRYKRDKKLLRISGKNLVAFLRAKSRE